MKTRAVFQETSYPLPSPTLLKMMDTKFGMQHVKPCCVYIFFKSYENSSIDKDNMEQTQYLDGHMDRWIDRERQGDSYIPHKLYLQGYRLH